MSKFALFLFVVLVVLGILFTPLAAKLLEGSNPQNILSGRAMGSGYNGIVYDLYRGVTFGDCMADYATGDVYNTPDDYCGTYPSHGEDAKPVRHSNTDIHQETPPNDTSAVDNPPSQEPPKVTPPTEAPSDPVVNPPSNDDKPKHPNSGKGNGSEIDPNTGEDVDPGNSGGHNHGGD